METLGFMAKTDWRTHDWEGFNQPKTYWFIEHEETREWLCESLSFIITKKFEYTKDPHRAIRFDSELSALTFAIKNHVFNNHLLTEHEFINNIFNEQKKT
jgi:hypothetical protein